MVVSVTVKRTSLKSKHLIIRGRRWMIKIVMGRVDLNTKFDFGFDFDFGFGFEFGGIVEIAYYR